MFSLWGIATLIWVNSPIKTRIIVLPETLFNRARPGFPLAALTEKELRTA